MDGFNRFSWSFLPANISNGSDQRERSMISARERKKGAEPLGYSLWSLPVTVL